MLSGLILTYILGLREMTQNTIIFESWTIFASKYSIPVIYEETHSLPQAFAAPVDAGMIFDAPPRPSRQLFFDDPSTRDVHFNLENF